MCNTILILWWYLWAFILMAISVKTYQGISEVPLQNVILVCTFVICGTMYDTERK